MLLVHSILGTRAAKSSWVSPVGFWEADTLQADLTGILAR